MIDGEKHHTNRPKVKSVDHHTMLVGLQHEPMCLNTINIGAAAVQQRKQIELIILTINSFFTTV